MELDSVRVEHLSRSIEGEKFSLLQQLDVSRQQNKELGQAHDNEGTKIIGVWLVLCDSAQLHAVSKLNDELQVMRDERDAMKGKLAALSESHTHLSRQFDKLVRTLPAHVTMEEHQEVLGNIEK